MAISKELSLVVAALSALGTAACIDTSGLVFDRDGPVGSGAGNGGDGGSDGGGGATGETYQDVVLGDGPIAYRPLDVLEGGVSTPDVSGHDHDAYLDNNDGLGEITFDVEGGASGTAVSLATTGSLFVGVPHDLGFGMSSYSMEAWVRHGGEESAGILSSKENTTPGPGYSTYLDATSINHKRYDSAGGFDSIEQSGIVFASLRHVVITFDASSFEGQLYIDGEPLHLPPDQLSLSWTSTAPFILGGAAGLSTVLLDEVAIYDVVLTQEQVARHYECATACP